MIKKWDKNFYKSWEFWSVVAILIFGVFGVVAYEAIGCRTVIQDSDFHMKLTISELLGYPFTSKGYLSGKLIIAGLSATGLAFIFGICTLVFKTNRLAKVCLDTTILVIVIAAFCLLISGSTIEFESLQQLQNKLGNDIPNYVSWFKVNNGSFAGQYILVIIGFIVSVSAISLTLIKERNN